MKSKLPLQLGEETIKNAPWVSLKSGDLCVPQHYLLYRHTFESVEKIIFDIEFDDHYPIFVCEDVLGVYIQVGIVGFDNYQSTRSQLSQKIVYGRKWRVEANLPSSEIIQTAFLAIKKAREHEIRELFKFVDEKDTTTPFSNHHDMLNLSRSSDWIVGVSFNKKDINFSDVQEYLDLVRYDRAKLQLVSMDKINNKKWVVEIQIESNVDSQIPETKNTLVTLLVSTLNQNALYYQLMEEFIRLSDRYIDETFKYKGFGRFSHENSITAIGQLSAILRKNNSSNTETVFEKRFEDTNYQTDATRVPKLVKGILSQKISNSLAKFGILGGFMPGHI